MAGEPAQMAVGGRLSHFRRVRHGTGEVLGVLPVGEEVVLILDRPGLDLQHTLAGLHVDLGAFLHRPDGEAVDLTVGEFDPDEVGNRQLPAWGWSPWYRPRSPSAPRRACRLGTA